MSVGAPALIGSLVLPASVLGFTGKTLKASYGGALKGSVKIKPAKGRRA